MKPLAIFLAMMLFLLNAYASDLDENETSFYYSFEKKHKDKLEVYDYDICSMTRKTTTKYDTNTTTVEYIMNSPGKDVILEFRLNDHDTFRLCKDNFAVNVFSYIVYDKAKRAKNNYWLANHPEVGIKDYKVYVAFSYRGVKYRLEQKVQPNVPLMLQNITKNTTRIVEKIRGDFNGLFGEFKTKSPEDTFEEDTFYLSDYGYIIKSYKKDEMISITDYVNKRIFYYKIGFAPDSPLVFSAYCNRENRIYLDATEAITHFDLITSKRNIVLYYDVGNPSYFMHFNKKGDRALILLSEFTVDDHAYVSLYYLNLTNLSVSRIARYKRVVPEDHDRYYQLIEDAIFDSNQKSITVLFENGKSEKIELPKEKK